MPRVSREVLRYLLRRSCCGGCWSARLDSLWHPWARTENSDLQRETEKKKNGTNRKKIMMMETMIQTPKQNYNGKRGLMSSIAFRVQTISLQIWSVYDLVNGRERKRGENPTGQIDCILSGLTGPVIRRSRGVHVRQRLIHKYDTTITLWFGQM